MLGITKEGMRSGKSRKGEEKRKTQATRKSRVGWNIYFSDLSVDDRSLEKKPKPVVIIYFLHYKAPCGFQLVNNELRAWGII